MKRTVDSLDNLQGRTVLCRVDFNVPLEDGRITDDTRVQAALPTIGYLMEAGAKTVLCSHLGRPQKVDSSTWASLSLRPVADHLGELLGRPVAFAEDCLGAPAAEVKAKLQPGEVALLENTRFHKGEEKNDPEVARGLAEGCDLYVNDAFGAAHRAHASTVGVTEYLDPCVLGFLMQRELEVLEELLHPTERPLVVILGGAKVSDKIGVVRNLFNLADTVIIGGGMAYTFLKANGHEIGESLLDAGSLDTVVEVQQEAQAKGVTLLLPTDVVVAPEFRADAPPTVVPVEAIPADQQGMDIGPETRQRFIDAAQQAKLVFWNGPMGVFEFDTYAAGTNALAQALADSDAKVVIGGGDSAAAMVKAGIAEQVYHICTGGGASLEFLEGQPLPGVAALDEA